MHIYLNGINSCYSTHILVKLESSKQVYKKNNQISNFIKIRAVAAELFCMDKQKDGQTCGDANSQFSCCFVTD
jgi:hypothetical protein